MPQYDDSFLLDCEKKSGTRSYKPNKKYALNTVPNSDIKTHRTNGKHEKRRKNLFSFKRNTWLSLGNLLAAQPQPQLMPVYRSLYSLDDNSTFNYADSNNHHASPQSGTNSPSATLNNSHKQNSLRNIKLAKRASSFKDNVLGKFKIPTPTSTLSLGRSHSPNSPRNKLNKGNHSLCSTDGETNHKPLHDLNYHVRQVKNALQHFKDVISRNKLEVLPGNGTVVLESIANVHTALQPYTLNENSSAIISATKQVYLSLGKLIRLCDEVLLSEDDTNCASLSQENVTEVVELVDKAVQNLVQIANEKMSERNSTQSAKTTNSNTLQRPEVNIQRTSLPDIPLTPHERDILEQSQIKTMRTSHSIESILRDSSPPPKPPLPERASNPPPLPPKRKSHTKSAGIQLLPQQQTQSINDLDNSNNIDGTLLNCVLDRMSLRSKSPDDNSSLLSTSSLDSALNHSREEEELTALTCSDRHCDELTLREDIDKFFAHSFVSMHSIRASMQSVTAKRLSTEQQNSIISASGLANKTISLQMQQQQQQQQQQQKTIQSNITNESFTTTTKTTSSSTTSNSSSIKNSAHTKKSFTTNTSKSHENYVQMGNYDLIVYDSDHLDSHDNYATATRTTKKCFENKSFSNLSTSSTVELNEDELIEDEDQVPPALPVKTRPRLIKGFRHSQYDNVDDADAFSDHMMFIPMNQTKHQSLIEPRRFNHFGDGSDQPPPLPVKKKHIMAYMEMFGNCSHTTHNNSAEFVRHSVHTCNLNHHSASVDHLTTTSCQQSNRYISHSQTMSLSPLRRQVIMESSDSLVSHAASLPPTTFENSEHLPPALPPKRHRTSIKLNNLNAHTPPSSPHFILNDDSHEIPTIDVSSHNLKNNNLLNNNRNKNIMEDVKPAKLDAKPVSPSSNYVQISSSTINAAAAAEAASNPNTEPHMVMPIGGDDIGNKTVNNVQHCNENDVENSNGSSTATDQINLIEEIDVQKYLILDGVDVKGGEINALIVHASKVQKFSENAFGEAFITTFRTFITPLDLIEKLIHRYSLFCCQIHEQKQKSAKESFSLLVRVVNDLTSPDLTPHILELLNEFVYQLVCSGQLMMAKLMRNNILEKIMLFKQQKWTPINPILSVMTNPPSLLDLKSADIAEQMTLLDAELFQKIEIPEVLIWAQEQCEERSPNLTRFTEHFNKMSYWARSQILEQGDSKDREKHVIKFIKIMKHLRKINNFNSYLALLSALDSAPIRRLEWQKTITEGLKEYCALIDSSSSFRAYRQALAETNPPCIPYIGLVLQDLTFVHIGNPDYLNPGIINFSKRWQQHNIVVNMKRFKHRSSYPYKKNARIIGFFDNFQNYLDEDAMWQLSESIKPRVTRKPIGNSTSN